MRSSSSVLSFLSKDNPLSDEKMLEKQREILDTLQGQDETVDLWKLRELALSPGGLIDPSLRKRAWPILTHCHIGVFAKTGTETVAPSTIDLINLKHDAKRTVWDVSEHFSNQNHNKVKTERKVSFSPIVEIQRDCEQHPPTVTSSSPTSEDEDNHNSACTFEGPTHWSHTSETTVNSSFTESTSRRLRWRRASKHEQKIVCNVVTSILRLEAPESHVFADDRFHYYSGLHNLTALVMVNLESPSLTSLVMGKLAVYHLRDAMRKERHLMETALLLSFFPILQRADAGLYHFIVHNAGFKLPTFALSWVSSWFASDIADIAVASRLLDVFLVSHPLMPCYFAVAMLTHHRSRIMRAESNRKAVYGALRSIPLMANVDGGYDDLSAANSRSEALAEIEMIIGKAIQYMEQFPPYVLLKRIRRSASKETLSQLPAIAMFSATMPNWCSASRAPNEWAVLQRAKAIRAGQCEAFMDYSGNRGSSRVNEKKYKLAKAASAQHGASSRRVIAKVLLLALLTLVTFTACLYPNDNTLAVYHERWLGTVERTRIGGDSFSAKVVSPPTEIKSHKSPTKRFSDAIKAFEHHTIDLAKFSNAFARKEAFKLRERGRGLQQRLYQLDVQVFVQKLLQGAVPTIPQSFRGEAVSLMETLSTIKNGISIGLIRVGDSCASAASKTHMATKKATNQVQKGTEGINAWAKKALRSVGDSIRKVGQDISFDRWTEKLRALI